MRTTARTLGAILTLGAVLVGALAGCSSASDAPPTTATAVTVGSQTGLANQVVAQLYGQVLADHGFTVDYNYGIGSRTAFLTLMKKGMVDLVPDYAGALLDSVDADATAASTEQVMARLPAELEPLGLTVLDASDAQKSRAYVTTRAFADDHQLVSIADLGPIGPALTIGSSESLETGSHAREALSFSYGVEGWRYRYGTDDAAVLDDLNAGTIQVADVSTMRLDELGDDVTVLTDPQHIVVAQNIVPIVRTAVVGDSLQEALDAVSAQLTTRDLAVFAATENALPATIATAWLTKAGLLSR